ncbi:MAG: hypothetical protein MZV63_15060 [Marinilabiliales bacterium]|nr:hypothetical protein [Marinilabiliales bacterium]
MKKASRKILNLPLKICKELVMLFKESRKEQYRSRFPGSTRGNSFGVQSSPYLTAGMNDRAIYYRSLNNIPEEWGTAVNVQAMVFGNMGETSATGVAFTRDAGYR